MASRDRFVQQVAPGDMVNIVTPTGQAVALRVVGLAYTGAFPEKVSKLAVLDGVTNFPARRVKPAA